MRCDRSDILPNLRKGDGAGACANLPIHSSRLLEVYDLFGFWQLIDRGIRETLTSNTLIDHIATTNKSNIVTLGVHETSISDHYTVYCLENFVVPLEDSIKTFLQGSSKISTLLNL